MAPPPTRYTTHFSQNLALLSLSLVLLPVSTLITAFYLTQYTLTSTSRPKKQQQQSGRKKTILISGVGMTKGLTLCRIFTRAGHRVIGLDFSTNHFAHSRVPTCGVATKAVDAHYTVTPPASDEPSDVAAYATDLVELIAHEGVDLWVPVSGVATTVADAYARVMIEEKTPCRVLIPDPQTVATLHDKAKFIDAVKDAGLHAPVTFTTRSTDAAVAFLATESAGENAAAGRRFIMKCLALDDASRADMTLLPRPGGGAETKRWVEACGVREDRPWIVQEFIQGKEYCTHAVVVRGVVTAFVACESRELLMHYKALDPRGTLSREMLKFTRRLVATLEEGKLTGQVSFDFLVADGRDGSDGGEIELCPIECNPRTHTAVLLLAEEPEKLAEAYLKLLDDGGGDDDDTNEVSKKQEKDKESDKHEGSPHRSSSPNSSSSSSSSPTADEDLIDIFHPAPDVHGYYWLPHDIVVEFLLPIMRCALLQDSISDTTKTITNFTIHLTTWRDAVWDAEDAATWWWCYQVFYPWLFVVSLVTGKRWSRINVSTTRVFESY